MGVFESLVGVFAPPDVSFGQVFAGEFAYFFGVVSGFEFGVVVFDDVFGGLYYYPSDFVVSGAPGAPGDLVEFAGCDEALAVAVVFG